MLYDLLRAVLWCFHNVTDLATNDWNELEADQVESKPPGCTKRESPAN